MSEIALTGGTKSVLLRPMSMVFQRWLAITILALAGATVMAAASTTNATPRPQPARWLIVVNTGADMERRAGAIQGVIEEVLNSGINGEMQAGDQLGIWTYNKELRAGIAPMQTWDPGRSNVIAGRSSRFVGRQKFEGKPNLELVLPELNRVVKESRQLTVLIFSDGSDRMIGTPYDAAINTAYAERKSDLAKTRMPLVTVLRSERGKYIGHSVSFAPWPMEFPPFTPEPAKPVTPAKAPEPMKSIIISTPKKPEPATNVMTLTNTSSASNNLPVAEVKPVPVEPAPTVTPVEPEPVPAPVVAVPEPKPAESKPAETPSATPAVVEPTPSVTEETASVKASSVGAPKTESIFTRKLLLILGMGCMWVAIIIALLLARRSRRTSSASLITRSFDRDQR